MSCKAWSLVTFLLFLLVGTCGRAQNTYYVAVNGLDELGRDGLSPASAWASLSYACGRVPGNMAAADTIDIGAGLFVVDTTANPRPGTLIRGQGPEQTILQSSTTWQMEQRPNAGFYRDYIISFSRFPLGYRSPDVTDFFTIRDLRLESTLANLTHGGIYLRDVNDILIDNVEFEDFGWAGINLTAVSRVEVRNCYFENANRTEDGRFSGNILTRVVRTSRFHHNIFRNTVPGDRQWGVGYKGGFHVDVEIDNNDFLTGSGFDIEIPFEQVFGVRIHDNQFNRTVSVPKNNNGEPFSRGFDYSMWIYDNYFTNGYDIEGTRGYMWITGNFFDVQNDNGRCYAAFGNSTSDEPQLIRNNVAVGVDRSFLWINGRVDSIDVFNNTIYYEEAGDRAGAMIDIRNTNLGWRVKNNLFVSPDVQPRRMGNTTQGDTEFEANLVINATDLPLPPGNYADIDPGLTGAGAQPEPFFVPVAASSFVVDRGVDVGLPFEGAAPDIGAYEFAASALPIELLTFRGWATDKAAVLAWSVAGAQDFSHFEVIELTTGFDGARPQVPYVVEKEQYEQRLDWSAGPAMRNFQLRMVDLDGAATLSEVITLQQSSTKEGIRVFPNPATERISFASEDIGAYRVYDASGKRVAAGPLTPPRTGVDVADLTPGTYRLVTIGRRGAIRSVTFFRGR